MNIFLSINFITCLGSQKKHLNEEVLLSVACLGSQKKHLNEGGVGGWGLLSIACLGSQKKLLNEGGSFEYCKFGFSKEASQ